MGTWAFCLDIQNLEGWRRSQADQIKVMSSTSARDSFLHCHSFKCSFSNLLQSTSLKAQPCP